MTASTDPRNDAGERFRSLFASAGRRIRRRLLFRRALSGATLGLVAGLATAVAGWYFHGEAVRRMSPLLGGVGVAVFAAVGLRKSWSDDEVALFLDERLDSDEAIATAHETQSTLDRARRAPSDVERAVLARAEELLLRADRKKTKTRVLRRRELAIPVLLAGLVVSLRLPLRTVPVAHGEEGKNVLRVTEVAGLEKVAKLAKTSARDAAQRERLDKIAKDAERLKDDLARGIEKREAQDRIAKLKDALREEKMSLGTGDERAGLEGAARTLESEPLTKEAGKALGDHDLEKFDDEMEKLANAREKADRDVAKQKLDEAIDAAKKSGSKGVARALEDEKKKMAAREKRSELLRELAKGLEGADQGKSGAGKSEAMDQLRDRSRAFDQKHDDASAEKLAEAMGKALEKLTPEERKRLAEKMRELAKDQAKGKASGDPQASKDLADELSTPEGQKELEEKLKNLAKEDDESEESKRDKDLDDAENGTKDAERDMRRHGEKGQGEKGQGEKGQGEKGQGEKGQGQGEKGQGEGQGDKSQGQGEGKGEGQNGRGPGLEGIPIPSNGDGTSGSSGHSEDKGTGDHRGTTEALDKPGTMKSRANAKMQKGAANSGTITVFSQGRAGGTANQRGTGDLGTVGPREVDAIERSEVPQEYRDQVRQYFEPK